MNGPFAISLRQWRSPAVCFASAVAGALAVPPDLVATPASAALAALSAAAGLWLQRWSGLRGDGSGPSSSGARMIAAARAFLSGALLGLVLLGAIRLVLEPSHPAAGARLAAAAAQPVWRRVAVIYVAAVGEEIAFRLVLVSALAGIGLRLARGAPPTARRRVTSGAVALSAFAFAAAHLPAWHAGGHLDTGLVLLVLGLNGIGGAVFGALFVRRGLAAAIGAHAGADCVLLLLGPLTR
ncbi:MAG: CPBP family glutamic-type intramembrane protease [Thermoanaerobaculia bacterium]